MKVRWTDSAAANWEQAFYFIAEDNVTAALAIAEKILDMTEMLAVHPHAGRPGRIAGTRELVITDSPFILAYGIDSAEDVIWVYAIYHGRRRWPERFPVK
jgi:toxin ParE1/3/4